MHDADTGVLGAVAEAEADTLAKVEVIGEQQLKQTRSGLSNGCHRGTTVCTENRLASDWSRMGEGKVAERAKLLIFTLSTVLVPSISDLQLVTDVRAYRRGTSGRLSWLFHHCVECCLSKLEEAERFLEATCTKRVMNQVRSKSCLRAVLNWTPGSVM